MLKWIQTLSRQEENLPPPPEGSKRTRCYRLNLDAPIVLSVQDHKLLDAVGTGPVFYEPPSHLLPSSKRKGHHHHHHHDNSVRHDNLVDYSISTTASSYDERVDESKTPEEIAIDTAKIFRHLEVDGNGKIITKNERATRVDKKKKDLKKRGGNKKKLTVRKNIQQQGKRKDGAMGAMGAISSKPLMREVGEEIEEIHTANDPSVMNYQSDWEKEKQNETACTSRQRVIIDNARDEVDRADNYEKNNSKESSSSETEQNSNLLSLVIIGEYNEFKHLVRDGVKNLHDAEGLPDEALLAINRPRHPSTNSQQKQNRLQNQWQSILPSLTMSSSYSTASGNGHGSYNDSKNADIPDSIRSLETISALAFSSLNTKGNSGSDATGSIPRSASSGGNLNALNNHVPKLKSHPRDRSLAKA